MPTLNFKITTAGLAAIANVGTLGPVEITAVKIGTGNPSSTPSDWLGYSALAAEIKSLTIEGSSVPADNVIHLTTSDKSADSYTVKEVGLYAGSTLFAYYSQADAILIKASGSVSLFAVDLVVTNAPPGSVTVGDAVFQYPPATETVKGVAEIATQAEVDAGLDDERIVTPKKLFAFDKWVKKVGDIMTGALQLPAGTKLLPSLKFTGSTTTGLSADGGELIVSANAKERLRVGADYIHVNKDATTGAGTSSKIFIGPDANDYIEHLDEVSGEANERLRFILNGSIVGEINPDGSFKSKSAAKAWVVFDGSGSSPTILRSWNVSSITDNGVGDYTINFAVPMAQSQYCVQVTTGSSIANPGTCAAVQTGTTNENRVRVTLYLPTLIPPSDFVRPLTDAPFVAVAIFAN